MTQVMYTISIVIFLNIINNQISARVITAKCPKLCQCSRTTATCDVSDHTLPTVLQNLPRNLTKLNLSNSGLTHLNRGVFQKFINLVSLSLAYNSIQKLQKGSLQGLTLLEQLYLQNNGDEFTIDDTTFQDTPELLKLRLEGNPSVTSYRFLRNLAKLQEVLVDSTSTCSRCNYTKTSKKEDCQDPGNCADSRKSPFSDGSCACARCIPVMASPNCTQNEVVTSVLLGDSTLVRVVLWLTSSMALISNLALIGTRCCGHSWQQKPLSIFIAGIALSNLFVTTSVVVLLVTDVNHIPGSSNPLDHGSWSHSICGPIYFLKHFGIYGLVSMLCFVVTQRCIKLGYHRCFSSEITVRRSCLYICEAWVLAFLLIILPWTRVTKWHRMCTASYETFFAEVMYFLSSCLVTGLCIFALVQVAILFWRLVRPNKLNMRRETRMDLGLIFAAILTLFLLGIPHTVVVISQFDRAISPETGAEVVTILLIVLCALYPFLLVHYYPNMTCLSEPRSVTCSCGKCKVGTDQYCPRQHPMEVTRPQKSTITLSSFHEDSNTKIHSATVTTTASVERMSADSLVDLETWRSQSTKTKSWVEACDYDDLKRVRAQTRAQAPKLNNFPEVVASKSRKLPSSNGDSTTSGVNDVSSIGSMSASERTSSFREAIHEHALLEPVPQEESSRERRADSDSGKTSDSRASKRLGSIKGILQCALSSKRQRSKSLPDKGEVRERKVARSQSVPFGAIAIDKNSPPSVRKGSERAHHPGIAIAVNSTEIDSGIVSPENMDYVSPQGGKLDHTCKERLASFFILTPAKSKTTSSPRKAKFENIPPPCLRKSSFTDRIAKSFSIARKSPLPPEDQSAGKTITLEEGDILTELPIARRQISRPKPFDPPSARNSTASLASTRFSLEWDPIGSMEGYADCEVLPPFPPIIPNRDGGQAPPKFPKPKPAISCAPRTSADVLPERISSYSLDWDPTSVQLRNSVISRDSLSLDELSDEDDSVCALQDEEEKNDPTVWV